MIGTACRCCMANSGEAVISPGDRIHEDDYWNLEHAYPTSLEGWLVVVLKRHCETLHDLTQQEWEALGRMQYLATKALAQTFELEKEYSCCFAETEGFYHLHFHVIPKVKNGDPESVGVKAFHHLKASPETRVPEERVRAVCRTLKSRIQAMIR